MYQFEIVCVKRDHKHNITHIGVRDNDTHVHMECCIEVIHAIQGERGGLWRFYTVSTVDGVKTRARVTIVRGKYAPYLRTVRDGNARNNLRELGDCGTCTPCLEGI